MKSRSHWLGALMALSTPLAAQNATVLNYWDFETDYADKAGTADGTAGTEVTTTTGHDGGTALFAPDSLAGGGAFDNRGYVDLAGAGVFNSGTAAFSMSFWFKIADDGGTNARGLFDFSGNGGDGPQSLYIGTTNNLAIRIDGT